MVQEAKSPIKISSGSFARMVLIPALKGYGNENLRTNFLISDYCRSKQMDNVEYSNYLGSLTTNDKRRICEIKSSIAMTKAEFEKKKTLLTRKLGLNLRKENEHF
jgi:hypothetical protein